MPPFWPSCQSVSLHGLPVVPVTMFTSCQKIAPLHPPQTVLLPFGTEYLLEFYFYFKLFIFCILRELIFVIGKEWLFLQGFNVCDFWEVYFNWNYCIFIYFYLINRQNTGMWQLKHFKTSVSITMMPCPKVADYSDKTVSVPLHALSPDLLEIFLFLAQRWF